MANFFNASGEVQEINQDVIMKYVRAAADSGKTFRDVVNTTFKTSVGTYGEVFHQLCASEGIYFKNSKAAGIASPSLASVIDGNGRLEAGVIIKDVTPGSRSLFMPALLQAVEDKIVANYAMSVNAFNKLVAYEQTVANDRVEQPVLNYSRPEAARSQVISQLAAPTSMLSITTSDRTMKIPTRSLGIEWSDQAAKATSLDLIALAIARQRMVEMNENANNYFVALLSGDQDVGYGGAALSTIANKVVKHTTFDASCTTGMVTQSAWMQWLYKNNKRRTIDWVITDIKGAMAIEARSGKPVITSDNPKSARIDTTMAVSNPGWAAEVKVFITDDGNWPPNTIMGIDSQAAIARIISSWSTYQAQEDFVLLRKSAMRIDYGEIVYRLFDDAFEVLQLIQ